MKSIKFNTTKEEDQLIRFIAKRAISSLNDIDDYIGLQMDLSATHCNGSPLDFEKLLNFDKYNFAHDIYGIISHIDRNDGQIKGGFLPRCSKNNNY